MRLVRTLAGLVALEDVLVFGGIAAVCYGLASIYPPAAWIFGGLVSTWLGLK